MKVKVVAMTQPFEQWNADGSNRTAEDLMVYCARVSSPQNQGVTETGPKLLKYCLKHGHWSVFEQAHMTLEIQTSRAISAQILRHRSFTFQEFSQRYEAVLGFETYNARRQDIKNRQSSLDDLPSGTKNWFKDAQERLQNHAEALYKLALANGIAKECARFLLPMSAQTTLYMHGTVRSWIHYIQTRTHESTQLEHREVALACRDLFLANFPATADALGWKGESKT